MMFPPNSLCTISTELWLIGTVTFFFFVFCCLVTMFFNLYRQIFGLFAEIIGSHIGIQQRIPILFNSVHKVHWSMSQEQPALNTVGNCWTQDVLFLLTSLLKPQQSHSWQTFSEPQPCLLTSHFYCLHNHGTSKTDTHNKTFIELWLFPSLHSTPLTTMHLQCC